MEEVLILTHGLFISLSEQNITFWGSTAQIITSIILGVAAIWTARIHHKNRKDEKNLRNAPLNIVLYTSGVELTIEGETKKHSFYYNLNFITEGNKTYHLVDLRLSYNLPDKESEVLTIPTKFDKNKSQITSSNGLFQKLETFPTLLDIYRGRYLNPTQTDEANYFIQVFILKPNGEIKEIRFDVTTVTRFYIRTMKGGKINKETYLVNKSHSI